MPAIIDRVGIGKVSPKVSMRGPERLAIGAAIRIVKKLDISLFHRRDALQYSGNRCCKALHGR